MDWIMEKANAADLDALEGLYDALCDYLAANTNYPGWEKGRYPVRAVAEAAFAADCLYVARDGDAVVGTVILNHREEPAYAGACWQIRENVAVVHTLAVHPAAMGRGVGRRLMEFAVAWAAGEGSRTIHLDTYEKNIPAKALYESLGFRFCGKIDLGYAAWGREWYDAYELVLGSCACRV